MFINSNLNLNFHSFLFSNKFQHQQPFFQESKSFRNEQNVVDPKYKTELCKKFAEIGKCPYGNKCRFAHGKRELVVKMKNSMCKKYAMRVNQLVPDVWANNNYTIWRAWLINDTNLQTIEMIYGVSLYEVFAKTAIRLYSEVKKGIKTRN